MRFAVFPVYVVFSLLMQGLAVQSGDSSASGSWDVSDLAPEPEPEPEPSPPQTSRPTYAPTHSPTTSAISTKAPTRAGAVPISVTQTVTSKKVVDKAKLLKQMEDELKKVDSNVRVEIVSYESTVTFPVKMAATSCDEYVGTGVVPKVRRYVLKVVYKNDGLAVHTDNVTIVAICSSDARRNLRAIMPSARRALRRAKEVTMTTSIVSDTDTDNSAKIAKIGPTIRDNFKVAATQVKSNPPEELKDLSGLNSTLDTAKKDEPVASVNVSMVSVKTKVITRIIIQASAKDTVKQATEAAVTTAAGSGSTVESEVTVNTPSPTLTPVTEVSSGIATGVIVLIIIIILVVLGVIGLLIHCMTKKAKVTSHPRSTKPDEP